MNESILEYAVLYLSTSEQSLEARSRTFDVLAGWEQNETVQRIEAAGLDPEQTLDPLQWDGDVSQSDVATQGEQAAWRCRCSSLWCCPSGLFFCNPAFD